MRKLFKSKNRTSKEDLTVQPSYHLAQLPSDCLHQILRFVMLESPCAELISLFTVSKFFYKTCQNSPFLLEFLQILLSSDVGVQVPWIPRRIWKDFFKLFQDFNQVQRQQMLFLDLVGGIYQLENQNLAGFQKNDRLLSIRNPLVSYSANEKAMSAHETLTRFNMSQFSDDDDVWNSLLLLDLSWNSMLGIPSSIELCHSLKRIDFSHNFLVSIPPEIAKCPNIEEVNFSSNAIREV